MQASDRFAAAGTSQYQRALKKVARKVKLRGGEKAAVQLVLVAEPTNQYDRKAIAVTFDGVVVGHVPREHTSGLHKVLRQVGGPVRMDGLLLEYDSGDLGIVFPGPGER